MSPIGPALDRLCARVAELSAQLGRRVDPLALGITDRAGHLPLAAPGIASPNGACRLIAAADGWIALNLARDDDRELIPAWLGVEAGEDPWAAVTAGARGRPWRELVALAGELGLPAGGVGEVACATPLAPLLRSGPPAAGPRRSFRVVDLSALWAGPMCGAILAEAGASVTKVESARRPDPTRLATPDFHRRLNGGKAHLVLDLSGAAGQARLRAEILAADVVITSARPRAMASLGLSVEALTAERPGLVWAAVTGYGWQGDAARRVAFGDDAAAAGGLVGWTADGAPHFLGDALADPVTGLAAAAGALQALVEGGGLIVDAPLARTAAGAAAVCGLARAA
jgi:hypothetical protein